MHECVAFGLNEDDATTTDRRHISS
jgi:hypothetical protein